MAEAVKELWPNTKLGIGPSIEDGFYYDFFKKDPFTPEDLEKIETKMKEVIKKKRIQIAENQMTIGRRKEGIPQESLITVKKEDLLRDQRSLNGKILMIGNHFEKVMIKDRTINQSGQNGKMLMIKVLLENVMTIISGDLV